MFNFIRRLRIRKLERDIRDLEKYISICKGNIKKLENEKRRLIQENLRDAYLS